jgi:uncharacterized SAM-binding protein YcdF (DUF218 family)
VQLRGNPAPAPPAWRRLLGGLALGALTGLLATTLGLPALVSYWRETPPLVAAIALASGLLSLTRLRWLVAGSAALLLALWVAVASTPLSRALARPLLRSDAAPADADAIFVFSSSIQADGDPGTGSMARLVRGLELLGEKRAPRLIVSELPPPIPSYERIARQWMQHLGVAGELRAIGPVWNTHDEAVGLAELCRRNGWRRIIAVSSPTHMRRAAAALEHEGLEAFAVPAVEPRFDIERLDRSDDRVLAFGSVIHDLLGYEVYRLRGWIAK